MRALSCIVVPILLLGFAATGCSDDDPQSAGSVLSALSGSSVSGGSASSLSSTSSGNSISSGTSSVSPSSASSGGALSSGVSSVSLSSASSVSSGAAVSSASSTATGGFTEKFSLPQTVRDYYRSAYGKTGAALKTALRTIVTTGHTSLGYSNLKNLFGGTGSFSLASDKRPDGKVWDMYSDYGDGVAHDGEYGVLGAAGTYFTTKKQYYSYTFSNSGSGNANEGAGGWNKEHSWPKSNFKLPGDDNPEDTVPGNDAHHICPTDVRVNNERGNDAFGEVGSSYTSSVNGGRFGAANAGLGYTGTVFEPINPYKGDFARMHFYMSVRYYGDTAFLDEGKWSGAKAVLKPWYDTMLRRWHANDVVSQKEIDRNNAIHASQHNRNPFIDYPELVDLVDFRN